MILFQRLKKIATLDVNYTCKRFIEIELTLTIVNECYHKLKLTRSKIEFKMKNS